MMNEGNRTRREPDLLQRVIHGAFGAFLGVLIGLAAASFVEQYALWSAGIGALACFALAYRYGDSAIEWIINAGWWA